MATDNYESLLMIIGVRVNSLIIMLGVKHLKLCFIFVKYALSITWCSGASKGSWYQVMNQSQRCFVGSNIIFMVVHSLITLLTTDDEWKITRGKQNKLVRRNEQNDEKPSSQLNGNFWVFQSWGWPPTVFFFFFFKLYFILFSSNNFFMWDRYLPFKKILTYWY